MTGQQGFRTGTEGRATPSWLAQGAAWYGALFAVPLAIALGNRGAIPLPLPALAAVLIGATAAATGLSVLVAGRLGAEVRNAVNGVFAALACMWALQANVIHALLEFGSFDGSIVDFRKYGGFFWLEWLGFLGGLVLLAWLFIRVRLPRWLPWLPIASFTLSWLPPALDFETEGHAGGDSGPGVFEFSATRNLLHLLPDGLQGDVVEQVLREDPALAARLDGFTLYTDHLGAYYGTAPALPAMLTGQPFDFSRGHTYQWITPYINEHSYLNDVIDMGYAADLVTIDPAYCIERARSCVSRPFSDWKSRGYQRSRTESTVYAFQLLADLTLYRLSPAILKERIHNGGEWLLADSSLDGASPWPDPVLREWLENLSVSGDAAGRYKFYHYIGTHKPPHWDGDCRRVGAQERVRENYLQQARCVLDGIARLAEGLERAGVLDHTAIIVSGDHGHDIVPLGMEGDPEAVRLSGAFMGTARPALLVKPMSVTGPLRYSQAPTSLFDIALLARSLAAGGDSVDFESALAAESRHRLFFDYSKEQLRRQTTDPIPHDTYSVTGPGLADDWRLVDIWPGRDAPTGFPVISHRSAGEYLRGARLNPAVPDKELAWLDRRQFGFVLSVDDPAGRVHRLVLDLHLPEWIGSQSFVLRVTGHDLPVQVNVSTSKQFFQEISIDIPGERLREGNNFFSLEFERLVASPATPSMKAAALLKSIRLEPLTAAGDG